MESRQNLAGCLRCGSCVCPGIGNRIDLAGGVQCVCHSAGPDRVVRVALETITHRATNTSLNMENSREVRKNATSGDLPYPRCSLTWSPSRLLSRMDEGGAE